MESHEYNSNPAFREQTFIERLAALPFACRYAEREMSKWHVKRKHFGLLANLVESANGSVLSDHERHEHDKSEH